MDLVETEDDGGGVGGVSHGHHRLQLLCDFPQCPHVNPASRRLCITSKSI